ncbi:hypothetical protein [Fibrobacter sp. UWP2]|uniref:hypothetical protein n=1 Tax=Fibrobacter sp. UWP2 TaxID=1896216 RepID=UPI00210127E4|nr:hypothetical protein [Fibrobacter sp. UWP2]
MKGNGEFLPVSKMPCDGVFPTATTKYEKRDLALNIPSWNPDACVQCGKCAVSRRRMKLVRQLKIIIPYIQKVIKRNLGTIRQQNFFAI